jgi:CRISPR-associated endonuclease/helicase Cas3
MISYAHSIRNRARADWEPLYDHSKRVADLAEKSAAKFDASEFGRAVGWLHDFGKTDLRFQARLDGNVASFDHAAPGAVLARERYGPLATILAPVIAGHHTGLMDAVRNDAEACINTPLYERLEGVSRSGLVDQIKQGETDGLVIPEKLQPPSFRLRTSNGNVENDKTFFAFSCAFFTRMLFSTLVDADFIATEKFYSDAEGDPVERGFKAVNLRELKQRLDRHIAAKGEAALREHPGLINDARAEILAAARQKASNAQGIFTMTVPTGGGKTLASLAFALDHAVVHALDRVIVVIPFTSVVEQTAEVFRQAFGDLAYVVLEHHSTFDDTKLPREGEELEMRDKLRLSQENWDAPIVVTTAVQFFESLFHNKTSRCRKLHNIARSVVILDEAQTLPLPVLRPAVLALDELARNYRTTLVLSTATQPALIETDDPAKSFVHGLRNTRELMPDPPRLFQILKRVEVKFVGVQDDAELARRIAEAGQSLTIVNTRRHARELFQQIRGEDGAHHLSTMMCAVHRAQTLTTIRADLKAKRPARVVSTSLIEAGVDIDFPMVFRAEAGLDQIAQAAGRCNREGRGDPKTSRVIVFETDLDNRHIEMAKRWSATKAVMRAIERGELGGTLLDPPAIEAYFRELYWVKGEEKLDQHGVFAILRATAQPLKLPMETVARKFRMIDDSMVPVLIPWDDKAKDEIRALRFADKVGGIARRLQRYLVNIPPRDRAELINRRAADVIQSDRFGEQFVVLTDADLYQEAVGLDLSDPSSVDPGVLVI